MADNVKKKAIKNSFWNFVVLSVNRFGALFFTLILARLLLPKGFGIYSLALSIAMIFYTFADLGVNQAIVRYLSSSLEKSKNQVSAYYRYLLKIKFFLALASAIALFALSYPLSHWFFNKPELFFPLLAASLYVFILAFESFHSQIFYAIEKVNYISIKEFFRQILRISLALFVLLFVASSYHVIGIFLALALTATLLLLFSLYYLRKLSPEIYKKPQESINKSRVLKFIGFLTIALVSNNFFTHIDSIMLGIFLQSEYIGFYRAAYALVFSAVSFVAFPNAVLLPIFSKLKKSKVTNILNQAFRYMTMISIPIIFGILILGKYFIKLLYGASYSPSTLPLYFLSFLIFPTVGVGLFLSLFTAEEKPQIFAKLIPVACVINIILNFILIKTLLTISPEWATAGAAIATTLSMFFYFFASVYYAKKQNNVALSFKSVTKPLISSIIMVIILCLSIELVDISLLSGIMITLIGILVYFVSMLLIKGIVKQDLDLIKILLKR